MSIIAGQNGVKIREERNGKMLSMPVVRFFNKEGESVGTIEGGTDGLVLIQDGDRDRDRRFKRLHVSDCMNEKVEIKDQLDDLYGDIYPDELNGEPQKLKYELYNIRVVAGSLLDWRAYLGAPAAVFVVEAAIGLVNIVTGGYDAWVYDVPGSVCCGLPVLAVAVVGAVRHHQFNKLPKSLSPS